MVLGHCYPTMEAPAIGRVAALDAGLPVTASGIQIDRRCGSGLQAVLYAAMQVSSGAAEVVLAGGAESMSSAPFYSTAMRWGVRADVTLHDSLARGRVTGGGRNHPVPAGMPETAENLRREYAISRREQGEDLTFYGFHASMKLGSCDQWQPCRLVPQEFAPPQRELPRSKGQGVTMNR